MPEKELSKRQNQVSILFDRKSERDGAHIVFRMIPNSKAVERLGGTLKEALLKNIQKN
jgi:hypothetical protein